MQEKSFFWAHTGSVETEGIALEEVRSSHIIAMPDSESLAESNLRDSKLENGKRFCPSRKDKREVQKKGKLKESPKMVMSFQDHDCQGQTLET